VVAAVVSILFPLINHMQFGVWDLSSCSAPSAGRWST